MKISIIGSGYVGLVSGAGLAEAGHNVVCMDIDANRIENLRRGKSPIFEPGLDEMLVDNAKRGHLAFTTSMGTAVEHAEALLIAVGTPPSEDGSADLGHVISVATDTSSRLPLYLIALAERNHGREAPAATRTRHVQAARPVTGLAALLGIGRMWIFQVTVRRFGHDGHAFARVAAQATLRAFSGVLRHRLPVFLTSLCRGHRRDQASEQQPGEQGGYTSVPGEAAIAPD